jgi:hypothetical protein
MHWAHLSCQGSSYIQVKLETTQSYIIDKKQGPSCSKFYCLLTTAKLQLNPANIIQTNHIDS